MYVPTSAHTIIVIIVRTILTSNNLHPVRMIFYVMQYFAMDEGLGMYLRFLGCSNI